jgi:hypothetical protein
VRDEERRKEGGKEGRREIRNGGRILVEGRSGREGRAGEHEKRKGRTKEGRAGRKKQKKGKGGKIGIKAGKKKDGAGSSPFYFPAFLLPPPPFLPIFPILTPFQPSFLPVLYPCSDIIPSDIIPSDTLPSDTLPSDTLPSDTLPSDITPADITPSDPPLTPSLFCHQPLLTSFLLTSPPSDIIPF